ncbi:Fc.00g033670.m01.CDS01 [Cosmosporella sp. VM-42]
MSTVLPTRERSNLDTSRVSKSQRVLACVLCQQRKVKCDRKFPCANCIKHQTQCVPATQARRRRRRFPERELLDRLRKYEDLLRQHNVRFEPLHKDPIVGEKESPEGSYDSDNDQPEAGCVDWSSPSTSIRSEGTYEAKNIWHAMSQESQGLNKDRDSPNDPPRQITVRKAWDELFDSDDHILLGSRKTAVDLSTLHPEPVHIFRLWQIYLDNVNPLLKVTHTPSLQGRIIEAAGSVANISPPLEALMFSIYSISTLSLAGDDCQVMYGLPREDLLTKYQFACQQALLNCRFLQSSNRDCLTALYLYLVSAASGTHPRSLSSLLGVAIRIAQRMGIHNESTIAKCTVLEAEMRRRLWWSLVLFDARIGEMAEYKSTLLAPTWDCRIPLNVNDSDLRAEMKEPPVVQGKTAEALFAVVRSELGEFVRHSPFYLDFTNPALKPLVKDMPKGGDLGALEKRIEDECLTFCDPENPLQFMTIWTARSYLSKCRLIAHYSKYMNSSMQQTEMQRDAALFHAFRMLECDTKIMASPLIKGYIWHLHFQFPFPAYLHIVQILKRRPVTKHAGQAWEYMSDNYEARFGSIEFLDNPVFRIFAEVVLQAWEDFESTFKQSGEMLTPPRIVSGLRRKVAGMTQNSAFASTDRPHGVSTTGVNDFLLPFPMGFNINPLYGVNGLEGYGGLDPREYPNMPGQAPLALDISQVNWGSMVWSLGEPCGW